jgi:hypothetical protein
VQTEKNQNEARLREEEIALKLALQKAQSLENGFACVAEVVIRAKIEKLAEEKNNLSVSDQA